MLLAHKRRRTLDIWPGFVDGLAALLMVVIFVLLLFSVGQVLLSDALVGRDEALDRLRGQMNNLGSLLTREREDKADLAAQLDKTGAQLSESQALGEDLRQRLSSTTLKAQETEIALAALQVELDTSRSQLAEQLKLGDQRQVEIAALETEREQLQTDLEQSRDVMQKAQASSRDLNIRVEALNEQLTRLNAALQISESELQEKNLQVENLGERLNTALAGKVEELAAYRSDFFGKLRASLEDNPDVRIEGDRFVLPSEVLFSSASAQLDKHGKQEIATVARTLIEIAADIPEGIDWVLRVDGHTDKRPVRKAFPSNWELSSARATSIVKYLIEQGIPANRLVAAGFAQYHPIDSDDSADAYRRNRRIELKLTSR
jgi:chemotaxis protein MotB